MPGPASGEGFGRVLHYRQPDLPDLEDGPASLSRRVCVPYLVLSPAHCLGLTLTKQRHAVSTVDLFQHHPHLLTRAVGTFLPT